MSWNSMETAPKDGTVLVVHVALDIEPHMRERPDVLFASYIEKEARWVFFTDLDVDSLVQKGKVRFIGWIDLPNGLHGIDGKGPVRVESLDTLMYTFRPNVAERFLSAEYLKKGIL